MRRLFFLLPILLFLAGCAETPPYVYQYVPGRTATLQNGFAMAPPQAPDRVQMAVAAANRIAGLPYSYGSGHREEFGRAYDCSGATSFVLKAAGLLDSTTVSSAFRHYGERGPGRWISVYARRGHVFLVMAGLRFDTAWHGASGPQWTTRSRPADLCVIRHPPGL